MKRTLTIFVSAMVAFGQMRDNQARQLKCEERGDGRRQQSCEMREETVPATGRMSVDPGKNGGVSVKGWSRNDVLVRAQVQAWAQSEAEAKALASQVRVVSGGGSVSATGPATEGKQSWGVTFEVFVPHRTDVEVKAFNGGVSLSDLQGDLSFATTNGGVHLTRLGGRVKGETKNGGVHAELEGTRWEGSEFDVQTMNGGVHLDVPSAYSAQLDVSTVNGRVHVAGATVDKEARSYRGTMGSGGAPVRLATRNGGIHVGRK
ncbi:MAG: DUF4097 family beta strand repeat protein [Bryobacterales bacterium]|nr:DUF4097 family beta strand repeat protein [Bryobacterales bacterium]